VRACLGCLGCLGCWVCCVCLVCLVRWHVARGRAVAHHARVTWQRTDDCPQATDTTPDQREPHADAATQHATPHHRATPPPQEPQGRQRPPQLPCRPLQVCWLQPRAAPHRRREGPQVACSQSSQRGGAARFDRGSTAVRPCSYHGHSPVEGALWFRLRETGARRTWR
jgi:hypothetical protein